MLSLFDYFGSTNIEVVQLVEAEEHPIFPGLQHDIPTPLC